MSAAKWQSLAPNVAVLDLDPRWRALQNIGGVIDIGFDHPSLWPHAPREDAPFVKEGADQLTSELCRHGDTRCLRAVLSLPIRGSEDQINIALWTTVPHEAFYAYIDQLDGGAITPQTHAALANDLSPLLEPDTPLTLEFGDGSERPRAQATLSDISLDELLDLYEATETLSRDALSPS